MRYAILIGINDYTEALNLDYCVKDAEDIAKVFSTSCNIPSANIRLITSQLTRPQTKIWETFAEIVDDLKSVFNFGVDDIFFYFSGHGIKQSETTVIFKNEFVGIGKIFEKLNELNPKTKILIFDSCYAGAGLNESSKSAQFFSMSNKTSSGYYILSSCAPNEKSKEADDLQNGRFTNYLIETISDLESYDDLDCLDVNSLFTKVDYFFKNNPHFKQSPSQQIKSIGSYPFANSLDNSYMYKRYDIENVEDFEWNKLMQTFNAYLSIKEILKGEIIRFIREYLENVQSPAKGNSSIQSIEVTKNKITLIDNGVFFDLFNPSIEVIPGGGIYTAKMLQKDCGDYFNYECKNENGLNFYSFNIPELLSSEICTRFVKFNDFFRLDRIPIDIPDECDNYTIHFEKFALIPSIARPSIGTLLNVAEKNRKVIYLQFHEKDWVSDFAASIIDQLKGNQWLKIILYKE
jgi:hypothetical protein